MKVLLVGNLFSEGNTLLLVAKGLSNLGHHICFWNNVAENKPLNDDWDFAIIWTNFPFDRKIFGEKKVCYVYLDDPTFWAIEKPELHIDTVCKDFRYVFTNMKWKGYDEKKYHFLPFGCLKGVHTEIKLTDQQKREYGSDVCFIGTNRGNRKDLIINIAKNLDKKYVFKIFGNGWDSLLHTKPTYFYLMSAVLSSSKIVVTEHFKNGFSTADFEKPSVGGALVLSDLEMMKEIYPMCPIYHNYEELIQLIHYYLEHEEERLKIVKEMKEITNNYTYEKQLSKMIQIMQKS